MLHHTDYVEKLDSIHEEPQRCVATGRGTDLMTAVSFTPRFSQRGVLAAVEFG